MGLFDVFKKKQGKKAYPPEEIVEQEKIVYSPEEMVEQGRKVYSPEEIVELARTHKPDSIYDNGHLIPEVAAAVNKIMLYDGVSNISAALLIYNDSADMKNKMKEADVDTLLIFFKFLAFKSGETDNKQVLGVIGVVQQYLISVLQQKLQ